MLADAKSFTLLAFIVINFLIIFTVKTRTTIVTSLIISHLVAVLFFSISIANYNIFKEIVLALIIYSMVILFLVSNYNPIYLTEGDDTKKTNYSLKSLLLLPLFTLVITTVFYSIFFITKNLPEVSRIATGKKSYNQEQVLKNPMILPSHPVHIAVKKFYLGKKFEDDWSDSEEVVAETNNKKKSRLKDKLANNFLLKRSSDVILIIVAASTSLLLLRTKKPEQQT